MTLAAGILGGAGYTGMELLRLLARHPRARAARITSREHAGRAVEEVFPSLRGRVDGLVFTAPPESPESSGGEDWSGCDLVFCAAPNGVAMRHAEALLDAGIKLIDLSADFRLRDAAVWERWYGEPHACPQLLEEAVYGLPEVQRERIRGARLVANPGCYPTAVQLGFLPLLEDGLIETGGLIADVKSGVSGAGRKANLATALGEAADSCKAYSLPGHRHHPEIAQELQRAAGGEVGLVFAPHLLPMIRGIHATLYARLREPAPQEELQQLYERRYADEPFVDVLPAGAHPDTRGVRGANICRLAVHLPPDGQDGRSVVVLAVEDNLVKGAAGQAVQNMNLMFGLPEGEGLEDAALVP